MVPVGSMTKKEKIIKNREIKLFETALKNPSKFLIRQSPLMAPMIIPLN
jgi:hypothetical protein